MDSEVTGRSTSGARRDAAGSGTVLVDLSDLIFYLMHHPAVSGIQRVVVEVIPHLQAARDCVFVAYDQQREQFVLADQPGCVRLLESLRSANDLDRAALQNRAIALSRSLERSPELVGSPGDVLAVLGASWSYPGLFKAIQGLKQGGVAVVLLMYDLIPVLLPGFPEATVDRFREFLPRAAALADRVPAISQATRDDFERYCRDRRWDCPPGSVTRLAADQWRADRLAALRVDPSPAWDRPFALMVSTVEVRKNHLLAFRAWQQLLARHDPESVPDLVCVGRLGWNAFEFLEEFEITGGLGGKVHLLVDSVSDARLAALYRDCQFTVYPSRYEGWGLPVAESLDMGKPVVSALNSSLGEAGLDFATYFGDNDLDGFVAALERYVVDAEALAADADRIRREYHQPSWGDVADVLLSEFDAAVRSPREVDLSISLDVEYGLLPLPVYEGDPGGKDFLDFLHSDRALPLTGQIDGVVRGMQAELIADHMGDSRGNRVRLRIRRPVPDELFVVVATTEGAGEAQVAVEGPHGASSHRIVRGEAVIAPLGRGPVGQEVRVVVTALSGWGHEPHVRSIVVVGSDTRARALVDRNLARLASRFDAQRRGSTMSEGQAAAALAAVTSSASWRMTKPLRDAKQVVRRARQSSRSRRR